jgi:hypothetical protein
MNDDDDFWPDFSTFAATENFNLVMYTRKTTLMIMMMMRRRRTVNNRSNNDTSNYNEKE